MSLNFPGVTTNFLQGLGVALLSKVRVATDTARTLATDFENTDTIDGIVLATGDRVLIKNQSTASENGVYIVQATGAPFRSSDFNTGNAVSSKMVPIDEGTAWADTVWMCTNNIGSDVVGTDSLTFQQMAGNGVDGDVSGPGSSTDNVIVRWNGTGGTAIQNSGVTVSDVNTVSGVLHVSLSGNILDSNGNQLIMLTQASSAVNEISIANNSSGNNPSISATGSNTDVSLDIQTKGTGVVNISSTSASDAGTIRLLDDTGGQYMGITVPSTVTTSSTLTLPDGVGADGQFLQTDGANPATLSWASLASSIQTATTDTSTTSATYVVINSMTVTPASGTYLVVFSTSGTISSSNATGNYAIHNNGTITQNSERNLIMGGGPTVGFETALCTLSIETVTGSEAIDVRYLTSAGSFSVNDRSLCLLKLS